MSGSSERLLCLRNRHDIGLINGEIVTLVELDGEQRGMLPMLVETDEGEQVEIKAPLQLLLDDDAGSSGAVGMPVTWGYALTCHKAQGSQSDNVLVIDEGWDEDRSRWLYTAITRAAERVIIAREA
jgi:exodeoxyribonuclease-5